MHSLARDYPATLLAEREAPCLSLYQPTNRKHPGKAQDPVRFRNLVKQLAASLGAKYPVGDIPALLRPFEALAEDRDFWNHAGDGLAVLGAPGRLLPGRTDPGNGDITTADLAHPEVDNVLDDLGEIVLKKGGEVILVPADRMPTESAAAAIYRF